MRILSKRQLKELVLYSPQHIARLEQAGSFPKRVQLGPNKVRWVEDDVLDWLQVRLDGREDSGLSKQTLAASQQFGKRADFVEKLILD